MTVGARSRSESGNASPAETRCTAVGVGLSIFVLLLGFASRFLHPSVLWGVNHLSFFPLWSATAVTCAGVLGCLAASLARKTAPGPTAGSLVRRDLTWQILVTAVLLSVLAFWFIRPATHLLGDQQLQIRELSADAFAPRREIGTVLLYTGVYRFLRAVSGAGVVNIYSLVGAVSGGLFVLLIYGTARLLGLRASGLVFSVVVFLAAGPVLFFCGYTENYAPLYLTTFSYLYFGLVALDRKRLLVIPAAMLGLAIFFHQVAVLLVPSMVVLIVCAASSRARPSRRQLWISLGALALLLLASHLLVRDSRLLPMIIPFLDNQYFPGYTLLSFPHLLDIMNVLLLVAPGGLILLAASVAGRADWDDPRLKFTVAAAVFPAILLFVLEPELGVARDWDIFAFSGIIITVLALTALSCLKERRGPPNRVLACAAIASLILVLPWILLNMDEGLSTARFSSILSRDPHKKAYGYEILSHHHRSYGRTSPAIEALKRAVRSEPRNPRYYGLLGDTYTASGLLDSACYYQMKAIEVDSTYWVAHFNLGILCFRRGEVNDAFDYLMRAALRMDDGSDEAWYNLANVAFFRGEENLSIHMYREALRRNPRNPKANHNLSIMYYRKGDFLLAKHYHDRAREYGFSSPSDYVDALEKALKELAPGVE